MDDTSAQQVASELSEIAILIFAQAMQSGVDTTKSHLLKMYDKCGPVGLYICAINWIDIFMSSVSGWELEEARILVLKNKFYDNISLMFISRMMGANNVTANLAEKIKSEDMLSIVIDVLDIIVKVLNKKESIVSQN